MVATRHRMTTQRENNTSITSGDCHVVPSALLAMTCMWIKKNDSQCVESVRFFTGGIKRKSPEGDEPSDWKERGARQRIQ